MFKVRIEEVCSQIRSSSGGEIHHQKGDFTDDIDPTKGCIELKTIEDQDLIMNQSDVLQMEIPVTFPDEPLFFPLGELLYVGCMFTLHPSL